MDLKKVRFPKSVSIYDRYLIQEIGDYGFILEIIKDAKDIDMDALSIKKAHKSEYRIIESTLEEKDDIEFLKGLSKLLIDRI